jgi:hypothetical protein
MHIKALIDNLCRDPKFVRQLARLPAGPNKVPVKVRGKSYAITVTPLRKQGTSLVRTEKLHPAIEATDSTQSDSNQPNRRAMRNIRIRK